MEVFVVLEWADFDEVEVESVWLTEAEARNRLRDRGGGVIWKAPVGDDLLHWPERLPLE